VGGVTVRVLGVDGCARGWAGIVWDGEVLHGAFAPDLRSLVRDVTARVGALDVVGVDMPIGLADAGVRRADVEARTLLGRRGSSIFVTATRAAMAEPDRAAASVVNKALGGPGISAQAWALRPKVLEVDELARSGDLVLVEVHPEVSFARIAGHPLPHAKRTWAGAALRRSLLRGVGIDLDAASLGQVAAVAAYDDVVDAAVVAWSAMNVALGHGRAVPDPPERFSDGLDCAIWS
jgi:predicted RNase H-like nuclease